LAIVHPQVEKDVDIILTDIRDVQDIHRMSNRGFGHPQIGFGHPQVIGHPADVQMT
jgi:hypothetical protein